MIDSQRSAQIYLADQRGRLQTDCLHSRLNFNFGSYVEESRKPFGALTLLNDDTLGAGSSVIMQIKQDVHSVMLPVSGDLQCTYPLTTGELYTDFIQPGQVQVLSLKAGTSYVISNPYETESINFIQLWLTSSSGDLTPDVTQTRFDLSCKNALLPLFGPTGTGSTDAVRHKGFIGQYGGRQSGVYSVQQGKEGAPMNGVYVFVLSGAFEVQNRLLQEKDGLALLFMEDAFIEFEALSHNAILLLLDIAGLSSFTVGGTE